MKIIKYILFFLCIFLISCMTNEITIENHIIEQNMNTYTCFFDIHSIEELKWIEQAAAKTGVQVFVRSESLISAGKIEHTFYHVNADCFQSSYPLSNPYRSLTKGVITEKYRPLSELHSVHENLSFHVRKNVGNTQQFFDIVTKRIPMLTKNANPIFHSPFSNIMVLGWLLFYAFVLFLSFFYISCIRRENAIRMCFGFSLTRIVLCNILLDIVVYLVLIITQYFILSQYSTFALTNRYKYYYGIAILCGICPYLSLFQFNVKDISHRNYGWNRLFRSSYVLKIASVVTLLFSFSLFASVGLKAFSAYQTANMMQILHAYDILTLESNTESEKYKEYHKILGDDAFADHQCRNDGFNTFYLEHRKDVFLMSASHYDTYDIVFYNDNASSILFNVFKDELTGCSADVVMLCPEIEQSITLKEISNRKNEMLYTYSKFCGARYNVSIESVSYKKSIKIPYFTINDNNLIDFATNPYITQYQYCTPAFGRALLTLVLCFILGRFPTPFPITQRNTA